MACLVTACDAGPAERRPHDVIAAPGGRHGSRKPRPGPKALAKWLAGSVRKDPAEVIAAAFDEAEARDPGHRRTWVVRGLGRRQGTRGAGRRQRPGRGGDHCRRTGAGVCVRYLSARHEHLCCGQALANGWPIAAGVIEGACRHLIADRLDITGARRGLDGAEAVLTLRAIISNGDFEKYWRRFHLAREHQRLYPGTEQGQYTLGA
jgi:hypothetical protein